MPEVNMSVFPEAIQVAGGQPGVNLDELVLKGEWSSRAETVLSNSWYE